MDLSRDTFSKFKNLNLHCLNLRSSVLFSLLDHYLLACQDLHERYCTVCISSVKVIFFVWRCLCLRHDPFDMIDRTLTCQYSKRRMRRVRSRRKLLLIRTALQIDDRRRRVKNLLSSCMFDSWARRRDLATDM